MRSPLFRRADRGVAAAEPADAAAVAPAAAMLASVRCTTCGRTSLTADAGEWDPEEIVSDAIVCTSCDATFGVIWGAPFIGHYERDDVLGLIEIAANARADNGFAVREEVERLESLLAQYHAAADRRAFVAECNDPFVHAPWFANRYGEYASFRALTDGIDLRGLEILDVGAGSGYDAWRLVQAGGRVTALEYNPMLIRRGRSVVPEARWIGGFSHVLPFDRECFDVVCCNAALHHMRDVPAAIQEMLRVTRRGGYVLTTGDPFRADGSGDDYELDVFDSHPDVLLGVNEGIPRLADVVGPLEAHSSRLDVDFLVTLARRAAPAALRHLAKLHDRRRQVFRRLAAGGEDFWPFSARKWLSSVSGSLSVRVRVRRPVPVDATTQTAFALRADEYATVLSDHDAALRRLLPLLPEEAVDRDFPGSRQTKLELLNGWRKPTTGADHRTGYRRARWFLTRPSDARALHFSVRRAVGSRAEGTLQVAVSGTPVADVALAAEWRVVTVPLSGVAAGERFVCELRVELAPRDDVSFDDGCFDVGGRRFA